MTHKLSSELRSKFERIAARAFQIIISLKLVSTLFYIAGYVLNKNYYKIVILQVFYIIPMLAAFAYSFGSDGIRAVRAYLWYVAGLTIVRTSVSEPFYIIDILNIITYIVMANFSMSKKVAARYFVGLTVLYTIGALVTYHFNPLELIYTTTVPYKVNYWTAVVTATLSVFLGQRVYLIQLDELMKEIEKHKVQIEKANEDYKTIQKIIIHDFINDLLVAQLNTESMIYAKDKTVEYFREGIKKVERRLISISDAIRNLRELYKFVGRRDLTLSRSSNIYDIIRAAIYFFEPQAKEKNLKVRMPEGPEIDGHIMIDSTLFSFHIMNNLLANAIKFADQDSEIQFNVDIKTEKINMDIKNQSSIYFAHFEKAFQEENGTSIDGTAGEKGLGLGLSIVKKISERLNVTVSTEIGGKAAEKYTYTVHLEIPKAQ